MKLFGPLLSFFVTVVLSFGTSEAVAGWNLQKQLTGIVPEPQKVFKPSTKMAEFVIPSEPVIYLENKEDVIAAKELTNDLQQRFGKKVKIVIGIKKTKDAGIYLVRKGATAAVSISTKAKVEKPESYRLQVSRRQIVIEGFDARGVLYGAETLRQLIDPDGKVTPVLIEDYPEMEWRVSYIGVVYPNDVSEAIRRAVRLKMNTVILESYWNGRKNYWHVHTPQNRKLAKVFFDECRKYHITPVPLVQGLGWGYAVVDRDPMCTEAEFYKDEKITLNHSPVELSHRNVVVTESAPIVVKSSKGEVYLENADYKIVPGETYRPFKKTNAPWKIQRLQKGFIHIGEEVLVSYNAAKPDVHKAYCPSEPRTYKIVDKAIDYVMTELKPKVVHIGHDEVWQCGSDSRCIKTGKTKAQLVFDDIMHWYNRIKKHNPDTVIMMWYDPIRTCSQKHMGKILPLIEKLPRDIVMCPWIYRSGKKHLEIMKKEVKFEVDKGFRVIGTSSGYFLLNNLDWYDALKPYLAPKGKAIGMMYSFWGDGALLPSCLPSGAELMWSGNKIPRELPKICDIATKNLKSIGLALTFSLQKQMTVIGKYYTKQLAGGKTPEEILKSIYNRFDHTLINKLYGKEKQKQLAYAPLYEQSTGMMTKTVVIFKLIGKYVDLRTKVTKDSKADYKAELNELLTELKRIGFLSAKQVGRLKKKGGQKFLSDVEIFGVSIGPEQETLEVGSDALSQLETVTFLKGFKPNKNDYRIYFIGDSITRHGFDKNTITKLGWNHVAGMAASSESCDYAHLLAKKIQKMMPEKKVRLFFGPGGYSSRGLAGLHNAKSFQPSLVIVQLGEHVKGNESEEKIRSDYSKLLDGILKLSSKPMIICTGIWSPAIKSGRYEGRVALIDKIMRECCEKRNIPFASVEQYGTDPKCSGSGHCWGVRWHPNDAGQAGYAKAIFAQFEKKYQGE